MEEIVESDRVRSGRASSVFPGRIAVPRAESTLRRAVDFCADAKWSGDSFRIVGGDAIVNDVVDGCRARGDQRAGDRDDNHARNQPRVRKPFPWRIGDRRNFAGRPDRRRLDRDRRVREVVVSEKAAVSNVERDGDQHRNRESEAGDAGGDDVVGVAGSKQQKRGVNRVDGVVPDQQRHQTESE